MHLFQCFGKVLIKHLISECKYTKKYENTLWARIYWSIHQLDTLFSIIYYW